MTRESEERRDSGEGKESEELRERARSWRMRGQENPYRKGKEED